MSSLTPFHKVVHLAIDHEMGQEDLEKLVDWTLAGKDPMKFYQAAQKAD